MKHDPSGLARNELLVGWPTVLAAALAISVGTMGIGFYSLGLFVAPLQTEYGWSRAAVASAATFQQFGIFLSAPIVGRLADRFGVRAVALASYIALPLALVALTFAPLSPPIWAGLWLVISLSGCGTTPAIWAKLVSMKFDRARGLALGLMLLGTGSAALLAPMLLGPIFAAQGWRAAVLAMAAATFLIGVPVSLLVRQPSDRRHSPVAGGKGRFERNQATSILLVVAFLLGLIVAGLIIHLVPMLIDRGTDPAAAARTAATIGLAVLVARVIVGYLFDRYHAPHVASLFLLSPVVTCMLLLLDGPAAFSALMLGLAAGAEVDMLAYFTSRYARIENYGATYGVILGIFSFGAGCGPLLFGWSVDMTGSYDIILVASAAFLLLVVGMILKLGPYPEFD